MDPLWAIFAALVFFGLCASWLALLLWLQLSRVQARVLGLTERFADQIVAMKAPELWPMPMTAPATMPTTTDPMLFDEERPVGAG